MITQNDLITYAFNRIGIPGDAGTLTTNQVTQGTNTLYPMIRSFQALHGMPLWKTEVKRFALSLFTNGKALLGDGDTLDNSAKPLKILDAWRVKGDQRTPMVQYDRQRWMDLSSTASTGAPTIFYADVRKNDIEINLYPNPDTSWAADGSIDLLITSEFTQTAAPTDQIDFPDHWMEALIYNLAIRLAPNYGVNLQERQLDSSEAKEAIAVAMGLDNEEGSIFIRPAYRVLR